ncbi:hypothetical protein [Halosimplex carlsbadense]|uniref:hypothetical protein n=1 Tax=Halosimplex carlsbadense TaxID=171164 RepID=UPI0013776C1A|nr:hypothetical protein [Halosimplex carlsbadense]
MADAPLSEADLVDRVGDVDALVTGWESPRVTADAVERWTDGESLDRRIPREQWATMTR